jgi:hypothetical protein
VKFSQVSPGNGFDFMSVPIRQVGRDSVWSSGNWTWIDTRGHRRGRMPCWSGLWIIGVAMGDSDTKVERSPIISCRPTPLLNSKIQCGLERTSASAAVLRTAQRSCQCISSGRTTVLSHSRSRCGVRPFTQPWKHSSGRFDSGTVPII